MINIFIICTVAKYMKFTALICYVLLSLYFGEISRPWQLEAMNIDGRVEGTVKKECMPLGKLLRTTLSHYQLIYSGIKYEVANMYV